MKLSGVLSAFLLLAMTGCGGSSGAGLPVTDTLLPELGRSALNLSIEDFGGAARGNGLIGTGTERGQLTIADSAGTLYVEAMLTRIAHNERLGQTFTIHLVHPEALAVGSEIQFDGTSNTCEYQENSTTVEGPVAGDGFVQSWQATGGSVVVSALSSTETTLQFTHVQLSVGSGAAFPIEISGTVTGVLAP